VRGQGKVKRFGTRKGQQSSWKKAYVRLAPGQDLDFVGAE
jgi:large subunit ribosomal protein L23